MNRGAARISRRAVSGGLVIAILLALAAVSPGLAAICQSPVDFNTIGPTGPGGPLDSILRRDEVAYPGHILLAQGLEVFRCSDRAIVFQWVRAAWHARTPEEAAGTAAGLRRAVERAADRESLTREVCHFVRERPGGRPAWLLPSAGIDCA